MSRDEDYAPAEFVGPVMADHRHVDPQEARQATSPTVGAGTPDTAPLETPSDWTLAGRVRALLARIGGAW